MSDADAFVRVEGSRFLRAGRPYAFAGVNFWYAAWLGQNGEAGDAGRLGRELDQLRDLGVTNLRVLASAEPTPYAPLTPVFQPAPGRYNEDLLRGLDRALDEIGRRGQTAVLYLNNQWEWSGGMATYVEWVTGEKRPPADQWPATLRFDTRFYSLPAARALYLDYVRHLVTRVNTVNGRRYADDPTIMAWQLCNEPRAGADGDLAAVGDALLAWADETSRLIRRLAPRQLISTGSEGVVGCDWSADFYRRLHALPAIDYLTAHIWPFNWGWYKPADRAGTLPVSIQRTREYLAQHLAVARALGKPLVLEEFGLGRDDARYLPGTPVTARDAYFTAVFETFRTEFEAGSPLTGLNLWSWAGEGRPVDPAGAFWRPGTPLTGDNGIEPQGLNSLFATDQSTLALLRDLNRHLAAGAAPALSR